jgi:YidC/Oxa1 family membrane protein insertase
MPKQNFLLFIVVTAFLIGGWWLLQVTWLQKPADKDDVAQAKKDTAKKDDAAKKPEPKKDEPKKDEPKKDEPKKDEAKKDEPKQEPAAPAQTFTLGDPKNPEYYLQATVTNLGGGIQDLTLPKFQKADENGRPVFNANGSITPLQLIEQDFVVASFLMYHYPVPDKEVCVTALGQKIWKVDAAAPNPQQSTIVLTCDDVPGYPELRITKTYTLKPRQYHIGLNIQIEDTRGAKAADQAPRPFRYQLAGSHGLPIEGEWYSSVYRSPMIGTLNARGTLIRDLTETQHLISVRAGGDKVPPAGVGGGDAIQYAGVSTQYFASLIVVDTEPEQLDKAPRPQNILSYVRPTLESEEIPGVIAKIDLTKPERVRLLLKTKEALPRLIEFVLLPRTRELLEKQELKAGDSVWVNYYDPLNGSREFVATHIRTGNARRPQLDDITVRAVSHVLQLEPGKKFEHRFLLYHGPAKVRLLSQFTGDQAVDPALVDRYVDTLHLSTLTDYRSAGIFGTISSAIMWTDLLILTTRFMHWLLDWLHFVVPNYGLSIMILTLLVRGAMFPVSRRSAMLSLRMQAIAPEMRKLQEKYKDDPQAKTAAIMELYKKHGVNPFGSCLPMLLQMPFFLGLYYCLQESIHFRLASFLWIDNLAAPDMLIWWSENIPIISDPDNMSGSFFSFLYLGPYFNLLPVIAVTLMLVQQKMLTPPPADEQQEMQQKMMKYMFIFIGIMFYKVAAGLCIYFIVSSLWGLCERKMLPKKAAGVPGAAGTRVTGSDGSGGGGNGRPSGGGGGKGGGGRGKPVKKDKKPEGKLQKVKDWWAEVLKQAQKK